MVRRVIGREEKDNRMGRILEGDGTESRKGLSWTAHCRENLLNEASGKKAREGSGKMRGNKVW